MFGRLLVKFYDASIYIHCTNLGYFFQRYQVTFRQTVTLPFGWNYGSALLVD